MSDEVGALRLRLVKELIDYVILKYLRGQGKIGAYDLIRRINEDYALLSPGTIYSKLYALERKGLIKGKRGDKRREFVISQKGISTIDSVLNDSTGKKLFKLLEPKE